jgi:predicted extracellular nuclease
MVACTLGEKTTQNNSQNMEENKVELRSSIDKVFGFYNVENLFDTIDDKYTIDEQFLPGSEKEWNTPKYFDKLNKLAKVITAIDKDFPVFMGFAEIENKAVILDLISNTNLTEGNYGVVHYESPDKRGIDLGFMYRKDYFNVKHSENIEISLADNPDFATRDILYIQGELKGNDEVHVFLNHWSSRRAGQKKSEHKRVKAATILRAKVDKTLAEDASAKIIIMGDFNDYPTNKSVYEVLRAKGTPDFENNDLFNMAYKLEMADKGTYNYKGDWGMLDQLIISKGLYNPEKGVEVSYDQCNILDKAWMLYTDKKYGDKKPSKTYGGPNYYGGYSDHLPIYSRFED